MRATERAGRVTGHDRPSRPVVTLLPGSGSDEIFISSAFDRPLGSFGLRLRAPRPDRGGSVVAGYLAALDAAVAPEAARPAGGVLVGGVSLGAQVAVCWAADRAARGMPGPAGLLLALPAWTGPPGSAAAAVAARIAAEALRRDGLAAAVAHTREQTPGWLGAELARAWTRHGDELADSFAATARTPGPSETQLAGLRVPVGLVGLVDDPVHPLSVAGRWRALLPRAALVTTSLAAIGRDREALGRAAVLAWARAAVAAERSSAGRPPTAGGGGFVGRPSRGWPPRRGSVPRAARRCC